MDGQISGNCTIDMLQELAELNRPMAWPALADDRSRGDIQGSEQTGGAMALVVVSSTLGLPGQDGLTTAQSLNLALLLHAQHQRVMGWVHVQTDYVSHLVQQQRIVGQLEGLAAMGTQSAGPPNSTDGGLTQRPRLDCSSAWLLAEPPPG